MRPANHPVSRLMAASGLLASTSTQGGTLATILGVVLERGDPIETLRTLTGNERPGIGRDRAIDMLASGILPLALALAAHSGDLDLADAASSQWERLPAPSPNAVTLRAVRQVAGRSPLGKIGARGAQGRSIRHSAVPATSLLRMSDRGGRALCQLCQGIRFSRS